MLVFFVSCISFFENIYLFLRVYLLFVYVDTLATNNYFENIFRENVENLAIVQSTSSEQILILKLQNFTLY